MNILTAIETDQYQDETLPVAGERLLAGEDVFLIPRGEQWRAHLHPRRSPYRALYMGVVVADAEPGEPVKVIVNGWLAGQDELVYIVSENVEV